MSRNDDKGRGLTDMWRSVKAVDRAAVRRRVADLKRDFPRASKETLHKKLVYAKCMQAGAVGAVTGVTSIVPVIGRVAGVVMGSLADATVVTTLQAELVAETFTLYDYDLPEHAEHMAVVAVAATNFGATAISAEIARNIAKGAAQFLGKNVARRALPIASIATSAASNVGVTYLIGMRAQALCTARDLPPDDLPDLLRQVTNIDERKLVEWAARAARDGVEQLGNTAASWLARLNELARAPKRLIVQTRSTRSSGGAKKAGTKRASSAKKATAKSSGGASKRATAKSASTSNSASTTTKRTAAKKASSRRTATKRTTAKA
jgi:uncharacterized protein (DUF697 family)